MSEKVILIMVDGMRPDGLVDSGHPVVKHLMESSSYTLTGRTVMPSVTLPCHMSLFHSVDPQRHGILTNTYVPMVRPITGLADQLNRYDKKCAAFYTWDALRDLTQPHTWAMSVMINEKQNYRPDKRIAEFAVDYIEQEKPDFVFFYLGDTDNEGHDFGWMSQRYVQTIYKAMDIVQDILEKFGDEYTVILLADHGGHDRIHGLDIPEDMTIPLFFRGNNFEKGYKLGSVSIKDVAVTVADIMNVPKVKEWEGRSLKNK